MTASAFKAAFDILQDREQYLEMIAEQKYPPYLLIAQTLLIAGLTFGYGVIMGSYNSIQQAMLSGIKIWMLFFLTLIICFPSIYIVQLILGSKIRIKQLAVILWGGLVMTSTILVAFGPIILFFQLSGDNYHFLQILHVLIFAFAGFFGMRSVLDALKAAFEQAEVYPRIGLNVFRIWVVIFAFVGMQLSWNLRPFIGSKEMPFELFRQETQGNFYSTFFGAIGKTMGVDSSSRKASQDVQKKEEEKQEPVKEAEAPEDKTPIDSTKID